MREHLRTPEEQAGRNEQRIARRERIHQQILAARALARQVVSWQAEEDPTWRPVDFENIRKRRQRR